MTLPRSLRAGLLAVGVMALTVPAFAADPPAPSPAPTKADTWVIPPTVVPTAPAVVAEAPASSHALLRYGAIAAVLGLLGYAAFESRKRRLGQKLPFAGRLALLDSLRIGPAAQLVVVSVGGRTMLLSVTGGNVRRICPLDDWQKQSESIPHDLRDGGREEVREEYLPRVPQAPHVQPPSFGTMLRKFVTNLEGRPGDPASQIAEQTTDRVDFRPRPPQRQAAYDAPPPQVPPPSMRSQRKPRIEDLPPARKQMNTPHVESQASGLLSRRSARGA